MTAADIWQLFSRVYLEGGRPVSYLEHHRFEHGAAQGIRLVLEVDGVRQLLTGEGNGPIDAAVHALQGIGIAVQVRSYEERSTQSSGEAGNAQACAFMELIGSAGGSDCYGVGIDHNIVTASIKALISGINRLEPTRGIAVQARAA